MVCRRTTSLLRADLARERVLRRELTDVEKRWVTVDRVAVEEKDDG